MTTTFASKTWKGNLAVSSGFGAFESFRKVPHTGVDIVTPGAALAPFDGVVTRGLNEGNAAPGGIGNYFRMVSLDGRFVFTVGHGNANSDTGLRKGDRIGAGATVMRDFGRPPTGFVTGPHYHEMLTDNGRLVNLLDYLGKTWDGGSKPVVASGGWDGVSTLYKGNYADDGLVYTIHVGETIWGVATAKGVSLDQVRAWTAALAGSKYAGDQLAKSGPGASWWDGSGTYYAGCTFAVADVVAVLAAEDAKVAAAALAAAEQAEAEAAEALNAAAVLNEVDTSEAEKVYAETDAAIQAAADAAREAEEELSAAVERARASLASITDTTDAALEGGDAGRTDAPLAGLFAGNDKARKRTYLAYAGAVLLVSFGPDVVTAGVLVPDLVPSFVAYLGLASSLLLKIGAALGFVAAANIRK
jgi:hypothetical protein